MCLLLGDLAGQFLDKVADMPVASMTGAWGRLCCYCGFCSCSTDPGFDVPVVQVVDSDYTGELSVGLVVVEWVFFGVLRRFSRSFRSSEVERQGRGQCTGTDPC